MAVRTNTILTCFHLLCVVTRWTHASTPDGPSESVTPFVSQRHDGLSSPIPANRIGSQRLLKAVSTISPVIQMKPTTLILKELTAEGQNARYSPKHRFRPRPRSSTSATTTTTTLPVVKEPTSSSAKEAKKTSVAHADESHDDFPQRDFHFLHDVSFAGDFAQLQSFESMRQRGFDDVVAITEATLAAAADRGSTHDADADSRSSPSRLNFVEALYDASLASEPDKEGAESANVIPRLSELRWGDKTRLTFDEILAQAKSSGFEKPSPLPDDRRVATTIFVSSSPSNASPGEEPAERKDERDTTTRKPQPPLDGGNLLPGESARETTTAMPRQRSAPGDNVVTPAPDEEGEKEGEGSGPEGSAKRGGWGQEKTDFGIDASPGHRGGAKRVFPTTTALPDRAASDLRVSGSTPQGKYRQRPRHQRFRLRYPWRAKSGEEDDASPLVTVNEVGAGDDGLYHPEQAPALEDVLLQTTEAAAADEEVGARYTEDKGRRYVNLQRQQPRITTYRPPINLAQFTPEADSTTAATTATTATTTLRPRYKGRPSTRTTPPRVSQLGRRPVVRSLSNRNRKTETTLTPPRPAPLPRLPGLRPQPGRFHPPFPAPRPMEMRVEEKNDVEEEEETPRRKRTHPRTANAPERPPPSSSDRRSNARISLSRRKSRKNLLRRREKERQEAEDVKSSAEDAKVTTPIGYYNLRVPGAFVEFDLRSPSSSSVGGFEIMQGYNSNNPFKDGGEGRKTERPTTSIKRKDVFTVDGISIDNEPFGTRPRQNGLLSGVGRGRGKTKVASFYDSSEKREKSHENHFDSGSIVDNHLFPAFFTVPKELKSEHHSIWPGDGEDHYAPFPPKPSPSPPPPRSSPVFPNSNYQTMAVKGKDDTVLVSHHAWKSEAANAKPGATRGAQLEHEEQLDQLTSPLAHLDGGGETVNLEDPPQRGRRPEPGHIRVSLRTKNNSTQKVVRSGYKFGGGVDLSLPSRGEDVPPRAPSPPPFRPTPVPGLTSTLATLLGRARKRKTASIQRVRKSERERRRQNEVGRADRTVNKSFYSQDSLRAPYVPPELTPSTLPPPPSPPPPLLESGRHRKQQQQQRGRPRPLQQQLRRVDVTQSRPPPSGSASPSPLPRSGLGQALSGHGLTAVSRLLEGSGLAAELGRRAKEGRAFTLFVPSDRAVGRFMNETGHHPRSHKMKKILHNHLVDGIVYTEDLEDDLVGASVGGGKLRSNVYRTEDDDWKEVLVTTINGAVLERGDLSLPGGVAHAVDRVLEPITNDRDIVHALQSDPQQRFTTFLKALRATRLDKELSDYATGPWTVFAPINDAFMNLPMSELEGLIRHTDKLRRLLLNHLVGKSLYSTGLRPHQVVKMASGHRLNLFRSPGRLKLEGANVVNMDISASNGVIHVVETIVELPNAAQPATPR